MKRILVPTDFSKGAFNALLHAMNIAKMINASIRIVHAYSMPPTGSTVMVDITDILKKNADEELENLKLEVKKLELANDLNINYVSSHGSVIDVINRQTRESEIDLVVMGTQGASGITEKFLGSNTAAVAKNIDIPMIAVPAELAYKPYKKFLFTTDMKVLKNSRPMQFIGEFSKECEAEVKFIHVRAPGSEELDQSEIDAYRDQVESIFDPETKSSFAYVYDEDPEEGIANTIKMERPDLIIVIHHSYGFFEGMFHSSVSQNIINRASLPILVMKG
jgi:nucleotide-binding universal stress UspA family protein